MSLAVLQNNLQACVLDGARAIDAQVIGATPDDIRARLAIYSNAYRTRLTEALASNYPALAKLLGADDFARLASRYISAHVSRHASIRYFGDQLSTFLATDAGYCSVSLLAELAAWEWAMTEVFDAADASTLAVESLTSRPAAEWAGLRFKLHPAVRRLELRWNVPPIWKALTSEGVRPAPERGHEPRSWVLWRADLQVRFRSVETPEAAALRAVADGREFAELCVRLCDLVGESSAAIQAASYLRAWMEAGLISGCESR